MRQTQQLKSSTWSFSRIELSVKKIHCAFFIYEGRLMFATSRIHQRWSQRSGTKCMELRFNIPSKRGLVIKLFTRSSIFIIRRVPPRISKQYRANFRGRRKSLFKVRKRSWTPHRTSKWRFPFCSQFLAKWNRPWTLPRVFEDSPVRGSLSELKADTTR